MGDERIRKYVPTQASAKALLLRIEQSIASGTWRDLKSELEGGVVLEMPTVRQFSIQFVDQYGKTRMKTWNRYELSFTHLNAKLGHVRLDDFGRGHLHRYIELRRKEGSAPATINRDIAALKKMFSFAIDVGILGAHPLIRFQKLVEPKLVRRLPTLEEERKLVAAMRTHHLRAFVAVVGETGLRKEDALDLRWDSIDFRERTLAFVNAKSNKVQHIPLSDFAVEHLARMVRYLDCPHVFVNPKTGKRLVNVDKAFRRGRELAGMKNVTIHDLRRFRATEWLRGGVDIRTVSQLLGHSDLATTRRYLGEVSSADLDRIRQVQARESERAINGQGDDTKRWGSEAGSRK